ncbi:MAG: ribonuclease J, partial [[Clostridium] scindens]
MKKENNGKLRIIPLGGLEKIGMNITAFEYEDSIIVVDCGLAFPEDDMLGIDLVIPDITYLKDNIQKVKGFVITHGHEDHIGALSYVLREMNLPIYATKLTMGIIEKKLTEHNLMRSTRRKVVRHGQSINLGQFRIEFIKTNHSIQDAAALAIYSPAGIVVHTGDFKVDYTPVFGDAIDLQRFAEIGKKGVLALMSDSTNAERKGFTQSERTVGITFDHIFAEHQNTRIIIATFASNVDRVQQIINSACKYDRKVVVEGRSMVNIIQVARELGYLNVPDKTLIEIDQLRNYPPEKTVLLHGKPGESMALSMADVHKKVTIMPGDTVIFSSNPIPGNEKSVSKVINELSAKGANVIFQDAHVSGHACQEELKLIYSLVKPKYAIPIHGEYRHRKANAALAENLGIPKENIFILNSGDVFEVSDKEAKVVDKVHTGEILVDGLGVGDVGNIVLRDRQHLAEDGILIVVLTLEKGSNQLLA